MFECLVLYLKQSVRIYIVIYFHFLEALKSVFKTVTYSESGSKHRRGEEQAWINFVDFLDDCEGKTFGHRTMY